MKGFPGHDIDNGSGDSFVCLFFWEGRGTKHDAKAKF